MPGPHFTPSTDPAFPPYTEPPYTQTHNDGTVQESFQDAWGRYWIYYHRPDGTVDRLTTDSGDPSDLSEWRDTEPDEEPIGRSTIYQQDSRPLEETTPLFGPQEPPAPEPDYDPWDQPRERHWDPAALRWVPDEPTSSVGKVLDEDTPWDQPRPVPREPTPLEEYFESQPPMRRLAPLGRSSTTIRRYSGPRRRGQRRWWIRRR